MSTSHGSAIVKGAFWTLSARFSVRFLGIFSTAVLARLLRPEDFGAVALVMSICAILLLFFDAGVEDYLIYEKDATPEDYSTSWTISILIGLLVGGLITLGTYPLAHFVERPDLIPLFYAVAGLFAFTPFKNIGLVAFRKDIQFSQDFAIQIYPKIFSFIVTIAAAFALKNYWALIIGQFSNILAVFVLSYVISPFRPRPCLKSWHKIVKFSGWLTVSNALFALSARIDNIILIKFADAKAVGAFTIAKEIGALPTSELIAPINRVLFPSFSKISSSITDMRALTLDTISTISALAMPLGVGLCLVAPQFVRVLLGDQWSMAVFPIQIISVLVVLQMVTVNMSAVAMALGRTRMLFNRSLIYILIRPSAFIYGAYEGELIGAVIGYAVAGAFLAVMDLFILSRLLKLPMHSVILAQKRTLAALAAMSLVCLLLQGQFSETMEFSASLYQLVLLSLAGAAIYIAVLVSLWRISGRPSGPETRIFALLAAGRQKLKARKSAL